MILGPYPAYNRPVPYRSLDINAKQVGEKYQGYDCNNEKDYGPQRLWQCQHVEEKIDCVNNNGGDAEVD